MKTIFKKRINKINDKKRNVCLFDEYRTKKYLEKNNWKTNFKCINHLMDNFGNHYYIPNFDLNETLFWKKFKIESILI